MMTDGWRDRVIKSSNILVVTGEASGDILGGGLVKELRELCGDIEVWGVGGSAMEQAGVELVHSVSDLGVTGFSEVVLKFPSIVRVFRSILKETDRRCPDLAVLIDYPDFNLRLAKRLKRRGIQVVYYVSPQMWAWRSGRVKLVRENIDKMMVLFPFEETWYRERGAEAVFVGHPVLDRVNCIPDRQHCRKNMSIGDDEFLVAMLPGSRHNEVSRTLPIMLEARAILLAQKRDLQNQFGKSIRFVLPVADTISHELLHENTGRETSLPDIVSGKTLEIVRAADFAWVTSGTASLETALLHTPQVVVYKTSPFTFFLAKILIDIKHISIANLVSHEPVATELIQDDFTAKNLIMETTRFMEESTVERNRFKLRGLDTLFGQPGASARAAAAVAGSLKLIDSSIVTQ